MTVGGRRKRRQASLASVGGALTGITRIFWLTEEPKDTTGKSLVRARNSSDLAPSVRSTGILLPRGGRVGHSGEVVFCPWSVLSNGSGGPWVCRGLSLSGRSTGILLPRGGWVGSSGIPVVERGVTSLVVDVGGEA